MFQYNTSDLQAIVNSNIPPSDVEARKILDAISESERCVLSLDAKIKDARAILEELIQERNVHATLMTSYRNALSPARRLPPEIIADIFVHSCPETSILPPSPDDYNLRISRICSGWRKVALGIPQLWSSITIHWEPEISYPAFERIIEAWSHRAIPLPLSIHIPQPPVPNDGLSRREEQIVLLLAKYAYRFREMSFRLPQPCIEPLLLLPPGSVDMLESVAVQLFYGDDEENLPWSEEGIEMTTFSNAPNIRSLTLDGWWDLDSLADDLDLPWSRLTDLTLIFTVGSDMSMRAEWMYKLLRRCQNLRTLSILGDALFDYGTAKPIVLSNLRSLKVSRKHYNYYDFFRPLTFPSLEILEFHLEEAHSGSPFGLLYVIADSSPHIKRFVTTNLDIHSVSIGLLLECMLSLTEWVCTSSYSGLSLDIRTLDMMTSGDIVPKLETLELDFISKVVTDDNIYAEAHDTEDIRPALIRMIQSRCRLGPENSAGQNDHTIVSRLRKIVLRGDLQPHLPLVNRVKAQGLEIEWEEKLEQEESQNDHTIW